VGLAAQVVLPAGEVGEVALESFPLFLSVGGGTVVDGFEVGGECGGALGPKTRSA
jgi:hypothetical protein